MSSLKFNEPAAGPPIATHTIDALHVQLMKMVVGGTTSFDTGSTLLTATVDAIEVVSCYVVAIVIVNLTSQTQVVTVTDGNDVPYIDGKILNPKEVLPLPLYGIKFSNGIKAGATVANTVRFQARGDK